MPRTHYKDRDMTPATAQSTDLPTNHAWPRKGVWMALAVLLLLGILVRACHWHPGFASDDARYMNYAATIARGERLDVMDAAAVRLAYEAFLGAGMYLFGVNTTVCSLLTLGVFAAAGLTIFLFTDWLAEPKAALWAVFLYSFIPVDIYLGTDPTVDPLTTMFSILACLLYLIAVRLGNGSRQFMLATAAGFALGLAFSIKESAFCAGVACAIHLLLTVKEKRRWVPILGAMLLGGIAVFAFELLGFYAWTGNPFYRFSIIHDEYGPGSSVQAPFSLRQSATHLITASNSWQGFGIHGYVILLAVLWGLNRRNKALTFPLIFCSVFAIFLSFGSTNVARYVQLSMQERYFLPVLAMGCVIAGMEIENLIGKLQLRPGIVLAAAAVFVAASLWAAKERPLRGTILVAQMLGKLDAHERKNLAITEHFARSLPLEYRDMVSDYAVIPDDHLARTGSLSDELAGRGLVVDKFSWMSDYQQRESAMVKSDSPAFRSEELYGPAWPPYKNWLRLGQSRELIGRIWWACKSGERPGQTLHEK